ncbi:MAG: hypothetical protein LH618_15880, partial [Saprospiraceae bacterium]|nr:hypothetical protein [Saprospiraceae bacterium]
MSQFVIGYMMLAFGWWSYHLWCQNDLLLKARQEVLELSPRRQEQGFNATKLADTAEYKKIVRKWQGERRMVVAEGLFFTFCLIIG